MGVSLLLQVSLRGVVFFASAATFLPTTQSPSRSNKHTVVCYIQLTDCHPTARRWSPAGSSAVLKWLAHLQGRTEMLQYLYSTACKAHTYRDYIQVHNLYTGWADVTHSPKGHSDCCPCLLLLLNDSLV